jgi:hypothetical protein
MLLCATAMSDLRSRRSASGKTRGFRLPCHSSPPGLRSLFGAFPALRKWAALLEVSVLLFSRSALMRARRTFAGSSLGSWGTSLPSKAFFKMLCRKDSACLRALLIVSSILSETERRDSIRAIREYLTGDETGKTAAPGLLQQYEAEAAAAREKLATQ